MNGPAALLRHFTAADIAVMAASLGSDAEDHGLRERLARDEEAVERALASPVTYDRLFAPDATDELMVHASPTFVFAVVVYRAAEDLADTLFVQERIGARTVVPVFDTPRLRDFLDVSGRRVFLADLLASYTKVVSGPRWVQRRGRWRRQRFSELDPVQLASTLGDAGVDRARVHRRLGDLALFLTGVFPDHVARQPVVPIELERLARSVAEPLSPDVLGPRQSADLYEWLGPRWYRLAGMPDIADRFDDARRCLVFVTDTYLFSHRDRWFPWRN